jgi:hypothetical protein
MTPSYDSNASNELHFIDLKKCAKPELAQRKALRDNAENYLSISLEGLKCIPSPK